MAKIPVFVAVPTMTNRITIQIATLLSALRESSYERDAAYKFRYSLQHGAAPVEYARNKLVGEFLRTDCEMLWFIDEDMLPSKDVVRLVHHITSGDADIVAARMYKFDHANEKTSVGLGLCAMNNSKNMWYQPAIVTPGSPALVHVDAVGTGCTVISRTVLEDRRLWFPNEYESRDHETVDGNLDTGDSEYAPAVFRMVRNAAGWAVMGEDVDFCRRAKALGYKVAVDMFAVCGHYKEINIDEAGDLAAAVANRVINGIRASDGRVYKYGFFEDEKTKEAAQAKVLDAPPEHRAVTREMVVRR